MRSPSRYGSTAAAILEQDMYICPWPAPPYHGQNTDETSFRHIPRHEADSPRLYLFHAFPIRICPLSCPAAPGSPHRRRSVHFSRPTDRSGCGKLLMKQNHQSGPLCQGAFRGPGNFKSRTLIRLQDSRPALRNRSHAENDELPFPSLLRSHNTAVRTVCIVL